MEGALPQLGISSGPSMSDGTASANGTGTGATGAFMIGGGPGPQGLEKYLPWLLIGGVAWLVLRKK
jgi:hypothetical protein